MNHGFTMTACRLGIAEGNDWPGTERRSARGSTRVEWWKVMMVNEGKYMWEIINVAKNGYTTNNNRWRMDNCWISCLERHPFHRHLGMVYPMNLWQYRGWFMITTLTQPHSMLATWQWFPRRTKTAMTAMIFLSLRGMSSHIFRTPVFELHLTGLYPLVNVSQFLMGKSTINGNFQ